MGNWVSFPKLCYNMKFCQCSVLSKDSKKWLMVEKHPEPEHTLSHLSWWGTIWPIFPRIWSYQMPSWQLGAPSPRRRGECRQGLRARRARRWQPWRVSPWTMGNVDLFKAKASIAYLPWWLETNPKSWGKGGTGIERAFPWQLPSLPAPNMPPWHGQPSGSPL